MDQAILINIENDDNKQNETELSLQFKPEKQDNTNSNEFCNLCFEQNAHLLNYSTIERELSICQICWDIIHAFQTINKESAGKFKDCKFSNEIEIIVEKQGKFYNLDYGDCIICTSANSILIKLNLCNHYCCDSCLSFYITINNDNRRKLMCPYLGCSYEINDYLIFQYLQYNDIKTWNKFQYNQFCYQKRCKAKFNLQPYNNLQQLNIISDSNQNQCEMCKQTFCAICWTKHIGACDFDKLFLKYIKEQQIIQCPYCHSLSEPNKCSVSSEPCRDYKANWQQCFVCNHLFCLDCKGPLELFESIPNSETLTCIPCKKRERNCFHLLYRVIKQLSFRMLFVLMFYLSILFIVAFLACGFVIVLGIYIALHQFIQVSKWVFYFVKNRTNSINNGILIAFSPLIIILMLVAIVVIYAVGFIPLLIYNIKQYFYIDG
ncbi:unnamed protein product (macronuclear) [Paramecium tetraurelia]|uniref:RING-type domain-containing protein n=1 Tax=Paramecium tetraurelia TaxID=5888 RepID=A0C3D5_PARTE|nr:uncharacterized protein GSPATT00034781001 [Paramecium tetraurelia]CAK65302.1 unnamed protein product [Paramecium tetraurelia]|eukprot:XP_001432699.1 hypothetical protein (macronuclear) [Paramecium tetraurelia strain d4-2]